MLISRSRILLGLVVLLTTACGTDTEPRGQDQQRGAVKADGYNSCEQVCGEQAPSGCWCDDSCATFNDCCPDKGPVCDSTSAPSCEGACGEQSAAGCWCDDTCAEFGDCCSDKDAVCSTESFCAAGEIFEKQTFVDSSDNKKCEVMTQQCLTKDWSKCPQLSPLPPEWCSDGVIETVPDYTIQTTDGELCKIPQQYCLTKDLSLCPQLYPLPPEWCSDGTIVSGIASYLPATDGKTCKLVSPICLTKDASACP